MERIVVSKDKVSRDEYGGFVVKASSIGIGKDRMNWPSIVEIEDNVFRHMAMVWSGDKLDFIKYMSQYGAPLFIENV